MDVSFDPQKSARNALLRGLPFEMAAEFDFESATLIMDQRFNYGEERWIAIGYFDRRLHVLCFVNEPMGIRVISFRKANAREGRKHGKPQTLD